MIGGTSMGCNIVKSCIEIFIAKVTSARFIVTVTVIGTLCWATLGVLNLLGKLLVQELINEKFLSLIEKVIFMLLGALISTASSISTLYFGRQDRWKQEKEEG